jgi:hypothetical protein
MGGGGGVVGAETPMLTGDRGREMVTPITFGPQTFHTSTECGELYAALAKAQGKFTHPKKDKENPYYGSRYADLASVIDATRDGLTENGLAIIQGASVDVEKKRVLVYSRLAHASGQWMEVSLEMPGTMKGKDGSPRFDAQSIGSAITYGRRYLHSALTGIASEEDDDGNGASDQSGSRGGGKATQSSSSSSGNGRRNSGSRGTNSGGGSTKQGTKQRWTEDQLKVMKEMADAVDAAGLTDFDRAPVRNACTTIQHGDVEGLRKIQKRWTEQILPIMKDIRGWFQDESPMRAYLGDDDLKTIENAIAQIEWEPKALTEIRSFWLDELGRRKEKA